MTDASAAGRWDDGTEAVHFEGFPFSAEQVAPIERRSGHWTLAANAGSGKTMVLVERFARAVRDPRSPIDPARILAITFTDKAAGELKARLRERFVRVGDRESAQALEGAFVTTFHGFCARVLRAHPLQAGVDPGFDVLDEVTARVLGIEAFDLAADEWIEAAAARGALELAARYRGDTLERTIGSVYARLRSAGDSEPSLPEPEVPEHNLEELCGALRAACLEAQADLASEPPGVRVDEARERLDRCLGICDEIASSPDGDLLGDCRYGAGASALRRPASEAYRTALDAMAKGCHDAEAVVVIALLDDLLQRFGRAYEHAKAELGALDFEDLQLRVVALLESDAEVRASYRARFELIMVDEFQDSNGVQLKLLQALADDNLFTVGDSLQSIYGFRHADVEIMRSRESELAGASRALTLAANFRSRAEILDAVNAIFSPCFAAMVELRAARPDPPDASAAASAATSPAVEVLVTDKAAWDVVPDDGDDLDNPSDGLPGRHRSRHAEARLVAQRVRDIVDREGFAADDIVVLLRALGDMPAFERALQQQGIATQVTAGRGYWDAAAVRDVVAYLAVLANPGDEESLIELLASPFIGLRTDGLALAALARRDARITLWEALAGAADPSCGDPHGLAASLATPELEALRRFWAWFEQERSVAPRYALDELIDRALTALDVDLEMLALRDGERRLANIRKLMRLAREHEQREGRDIRGFLDSVALRQELEIREGEPPVESDGQGAVRLMTVHAAKGLEFPVVVLADLGREPPTDSPDLLVDPATRRVGVRLARTDRAGIPALALEELVAQARAAAALEEQRVFYVAMTRARERLVLSGAVALDPWPDGAKRPPLAWMLPALDPELPGLLSTQPQGQRTVVFGSRVAEVRFARNSPETVGLVLRRSSLAANLPATATLGSGAPVAPSPTRPQSPPTAAAGPAPVQSLSYSSLETYAQCGLKFYATKVLGLPKRRRETVAGEGMDAATRGSLLHVLLEHLDFGAPVVAGAESIAAQAAAIGATPDPDEIEAIRETIAAFAAGDLCARLARANAIRREAPFAFALPGVGGVLVTGFVDVIAYERDGAVLVLDYKSDKLNDDEDLEARTRHGYGTQRLVYALAVLTAGAASVEVVHSYLRRPDEPASVLYAAADRSSLETALSDLASGAIDGVFPLTDEPHRWLCGECPIRGGLCPYPPALTDRATPAPR